MSSHKFTVFKGSESGNVIQTTTEKKLGNDEVLIKVTHSGLCGTDCHYKHADQGLGHEGAGIVEAAGPGCIRLKKGDRVGWGYIHNSCGQCQMCLTSREQFCAEKEMYGIANFDQGSMATHAIWNEKFVFNIPDGMDLANAAPLQCGGTTVFGALFEYNVKPTDTVGVLGIGGLGHLAIQFASKMGCRVIVFSGTDSKREEAMALGAHEFYAMKGVTEVDIPHKLNYLLATGSGKPDFSLYFPAMEAGGTIIPLGVDGGDVVAPYAPLLLNSLRIGGSVVAPRSVHRLMLEFAARNNVKPVINEFPMTVEGIEEAFTKLNEGKIRYRAVLKN